MARTGGISGLAVGMAAAGGFLVYAGVRDVELIEGLREITSGKVPAGRPPKVTPAPVQGLGSAEPSGTGRLEDAPPTGTAQAIVAEARRQLGKPYRWAAAGPDAFDCSGLVVWCLNKSGVKVRRLTSWGFQTWSGAFNVARGAIRAGDLVTYNGHIGIAISNSQMIHAPRAGKPVQVSSIYNGPGGPQGRRVKT